MPSDPSDGENVAFLNFVFENKSESFRSHVNGAAGDGDPAGDVLPAHIDHARASLLIQMT